MPYDETGEHVIDCEREVLAALAATEDAPLSEDELDVMDAFLIREYEDNNRVANGRRAVAEIRSLRARLAAARAERDALRERVRRITEPYLALLLDHDSRKWIAPQIWFAVEQAVKGTPARPTDTGRDG